MSDQSNREFSRIETQVQGMLQDIKILEANMAVLTDYRRELVDSRLRDRVTMLEGALTGLKEDMADTRSSVRFESQRIQEQFTDAVRSINGKYEEEARKTRRWMGYAITISAALIGTAGTALGLLIHH